MVIYEVYFKGPIAQGGVLFMDALDAQNYAAEFVALGIPAQVTPRAVFEPRKLEPGKVYPTRMDYTSELSLAVGAKENEHRASKKGGIK